MKVVKYTKLTLYAKFNLIYVIYILGLNGNSRCNFTIGDGVGVSEVKIGYQKGSVCIDACFQMSKFDATINGVTIYSNTNKPGCWCEKGMTSINSDGEYKTCFLESKTYT